MKGYGMHYFNDNNIKGDLLIKIFIETIKITSEQKVKIWKRICGLEGNLGWRGNPKSKKWKMEKWICH